MATTKIRSSSIEDGQVSNADLSATIGVTGGQIADDAITTAKILDNNVTLAKMAGLARGKIIVGDASGDPSALALGASTQVLTSDGSDAAWAAAGSGNTVFISKQTASDDASLEFTSGFSTDYFEYIFKFDNLKPATDTVDILMYLSNDAGSSYYTANMYSVSWFTSRLSGSATSSDLLAKEVWNGAFAYMSWNQGNDAASEWRSAGELRLYRASVSQNTAWTSTQVQFEMDNKFSRQITGGCTSGAEEIVNGIKFAFSSGNVTSGDIYMYGVKAE